MKFRIPVRVLVLLGAVLLSVSPVVASASTIYNALPSPLPPNAPSQPFQAQQTFEFGDYVHLGGSDRTLTAVTVAMSNWALASTPANVTYCSNNPSKCYAGGFIHPITINIYSNHLSGSGVPDTLLATKTQDIQVPWRPEADPTCPGGTAWRAADTNCYNGFAFNAVFDLASLNVALPTDVIVSLAYNTQSYGTAPIGVDGPYNSLNVLVPASQPVSVGSDDSNNEVFWNTVTASWYADGGASGVGTFRKDTNWAPYGTIAMKIEASAPAASTLVVHPADMATSFADVISNPTKWFFYNDETDAIDNTLGSFVAGPAVAPLGVGSAQISVSGTQRRNLSTYQFSGTKLADVTILKFSTYNPSAGNPGSTNRSAYLNFNVDFNGSDSWQKRLVFVPSQNGTVTQNNWKEWDALQGGNAQWTYSGATWPTAATGPDANLVGVPGTTLRTWSNILADYPGIRVRVTDSWLGLRVGEPYADGYTENLDKFVFSTASTMTTWDFDPVQTGSVTVTKAANGGNGTFSFTSNIPGHTSFNITTAAGTGSVTFSGIPVGAYAVSETVPSGWTMNSNACSSVTISYNQTASCTVTNTKLPTGTASISGVKFQDMDGDGVKESGDGGLSGWTIYIDGNNNSQLDSGEKTSVTSSTGAYSFTNLPAGTYIVREVLQAGWIQTFPSAGKHTLTLTSTQSATGKNFGNFKLGSISGMKFNDKNANRKKDAGENGLQGWTIKLKKGTVVVASTVTNAQGNYSFPNLTAGTYSISEVMQPGWVQRVAPGTVTITSGKNSTGNNFGNNTRKSSQNGN